MKVTILEWHAVAAWRWDAPADDVCGICSQPYDSTCPKCKYPGDDCSIVEGECTHTFHMHCIATWMQHDPKSQCPMCRQDFKFKGENVAQEPQGEEGRDVGEGAAV
ncbi:RING/U-box [Viridothelium virens]|uniref:Anaphase-promoting complex subunit 11 n=1 Tax=Viridothelium virens TaxID=1048519 RepID=A0A6A6GZ88_VIRVR|nr:RING/U-box [Viridothelium virens]